MSRKEKKEKGNHISFRAMIIAMIVALLAFIRIGNFELGNGDGADVDGDGSKSGTVTESIDANEDNEKTTLSDDTNKGITGALVVYVREDKIILVENDEEIEVTLEELEVKVDALANDSMVTLKDDGAINRVYVDVEEMIKSKSNIKNLVD